MDDLDLHRRRARRRRQHLRRLLRPLPRRANLGRYPVLKWFAAPARRAAFLWSFRRRHVMASIYLGSVLAFLPVYGLQLLLGLGLALLARGNLTVMSALQMIVNPLTLVPIYGFTGWCGLRLMDWAGLGEGWPEPLRWTNALFVGGVLVGLAFALLADLVWRLAAWEAARLRERLAPQRPAAARPQP
jgi:uncharacterized protein (DUF2062 family)